MNHELEKEFNETVVSKSRYIHGRPEKNSKNDRNSRGSSPDLNQVPSAHRAVSSQLHCPVTDSSVKWVALQVSPAVSSLRAVRTHMDENGGGQ